MHAEEGKDRQHNDDEPDEINHTTHDFCSSDADKQFGVGRVPVDKKFGLSNEGT